MTQTKAPMRRSRKRLSARLGEREQQLRDPRLSPAEAWANFNMEVRLHLLDKLRLQTKEYRRAKFLVLNDLHLAHARQGPIPAWEAARLYRNALIMQKLLFPEIENPPHTTTKHIQPNQRGLRILLREKMDAAKQSPKNRFVPMDPVLWMHIDRLNEDALKQTLGNRLYTSLVQALRRTTKIMTDN